MWVPLSPSPVEPVQVVVPDQREGGDEYSGQHQVADRYAKQVILAHKVAVSVDVGDPDVDKDLYDVGDDGEGPGDDLPAGAQTGPGRGAAGRRGDVMWRGQAAQLHSPLSGRHGRDGIGRLERLGSGHFAVTSFACSR